MISRCIQQKQRWTASCHKHVRAWWYVHMLLNTISLNINQIDIIQQQVAGKDSILL